MIIHTEERKRARGFSDLLDYHATVDDGVQLLASGTFLAAWQLRGPDMDSMPIETSSDICQKIAEAFRLGAGWTVQSDQFQAESAEYQTIAEWPDLTSQVIDREREVHFTSRGENARYKTDLYLCVTYQPAQVKGSKGFDWFFGETREEGKAERDLRTFERQIAAIDAALHANLLVEETTFVRRLKHRTEGRRRFDDLARYVRRCVSGEDFPFAVPSVPLFLNQLYATDDFTGGKFPMLGDNHIYTIALSKYPERPGSGSYPGILSVLGKLPFRFRFVQQGQCIPPIAAKKLHETNAGRWGVVKTGLKVFRRNPATQRIDPHAARLEQEATDASSDAEHGLEYYVRYSAKVILMGPDPGVLNEQFKRVNDTVQQAGFGVRLETINATQGWLSSLPGHAHKERRLFLATVDNLSHMAQLGAPFLGLESNPSRYLPPKTPPLFYACTMGRTPYRYHPHISDVGHTAIAGPTGTGKTTAVGLMVAQHARLHPKAQVFAFDKEKTLFTLIHAMGGDYYDLSPDETKLRFCPLQNLETASDRSWGAAYIEFLCSLGGLALNSSQRNAISEAILIAAEGKARSLTHFQALVGPMAPEISHALQFYTMGSTASGGILDGQSDNLSLGRVAAFEMGKLYKMDPKITSAVLYYLFHRIWERLDPSFPTLISVDELRSSLDKPLAIENFERFLIEGRKLNMWCVLAIQELDKILKSPLAHTVTRECQTKWFLPNASAKTTERAVYELFGADEQDIDNIAGGQRCRDYYVMSPYGKRYITLELGPVALSFLAASGKQDRIEVQRLKAMFPADWQAHWLRQRGLNDWAAYYDSLVPKEVRYASATA